MDVTLSDPVVLKIIFVTTVKIRMVIGIIGLCDSIRRRKTSLLIKLIFYLGDRKNKLLEKVTFLSLLLLMPTVKLYFLWIAGFLALIIAHTLK